MLHRVRATPCPIQDPYPRRESFFNESTTATSFDFTTEFTRTNLLTAVKPRRRQTNVRKEVVIREDEVVEGAPASQPQAPGPMFARPAKRVKGRVSFVASTATSASQAIRYGERGIKANTEAKSAPVSSPNGADGRLTQIPRRHVSTYAQGVSKPVDDPTVTFSFNPPLQESDKKLAKPPRRGTIYIPPDDTTMPSIYMGIFSPVKDMPAIEEGEKLQEEEMTGIAAQMAKRRGRRISLAAEPARRFGPLRPLLRTVVEQDGNPSVEEDFNRPGIGGGKENMPPGYMPANLAKKQRQSFHNSSINSHGYMQPKESNRRVSYAPAATKQTAEARKPAWNSGSQSKTVQARVIAPKPPAKQQVPPKRENEQPAPKPPNSLMLPNLRNQVINPAKRFPPISEDISNPSMYEDNWLTHQELAITQLLNNLYASVRSQEPIDARVLRIKLMEMYQSTSYALLHKRLQGAILYGALCVPNELLFTASRLRDDLGMKETFINLWCQTYDLFALRAALEVVVGRHCPNCPKGMHTFIDTFLIRNEDGWPEDDCTDVAAWSYRRTILRSLMIIRILDQEKTAEHSVFTKPLFLQTSPYKASAAVLHAVIQLLNPTIGLRPLNHLNYTVSHVQYPLEEFEYKVENLAADLRDGIRLTRLVELLLYPSASRSLAQHCDEEVMMTLSMPTGEILSMLEGEQEWPLSQHLKFPCLGRATKLFNVQIALSALQGVRGLQKIVQDVRAEDIVDGYREKTVALLWGLTGKWGMGALVDWADLRQEIRRLHRRNKSSESQLLDEEDLDEVEHNFVGHKTLLKAWASAVASTKGLKLNNLTTSFADGKAFQAIVDEYEPYLHSSVEVCSSFRQAPLHERLNDLGCSTQFSQLFAPSSVDGATRSHIYDRDFTVAALAFLCSRLLSASKKPRAAAVIQRCWRAHQARVQVYKQKIARQLASQCAEVVQARERILGAKETIVRCWREYKARGKDMKKGRLVESETYDGNESDAGDLWLSL